MRRGAAVASVLVIAALVAAGGGWLAMRPTASGADVPVASTGAERVPKAAPVPVAPPPTAAPRYDGPLAETMTRLDEQRKAGPTANFQARREALERAAAAGDAGAAAELGELMLTCESYIEFGEHDLEALLVEGIATFGKEMLQLPDSVPLDAVVDSAGYELNRLRKTCDGASGLELTTDDRRHALDLLRQGARAGNTGAMANFSLYAFHDFADRRAMIADPQAVRERKREARQYLDRAIAAGSVEALWAAANAHHEGVFVEKSGVLAYANFYAYRQASLQGGVEPRVFEAELALYAADLTPAQIADARRRGEAIYARCCRTPGGGS